MSISPSASSQSAAAERSPVERVLRRWDLGDPADDTQERAWQAAGPARWRVDTARGPILLERLPDDEDRRQVLFRLHVTTRLAAAGLPVAAPVPARNGRQLVAVDRARYTVHPWVGGRHRAGADLAVGECRELGELLGGLHAELDTLTPPVQQSLLLPVPRARDAVMLAERLLAGGHGGLTSEVEAALITRRGLLTDLADHQPPEAEAVTAGYVHGDLRPSHLVFGEAGDVVAIHGWRRLRIAPIAGEVVAVAVSLFAPAGSGPGGDGALPALDLERVEAFVRGHASAFALDAAQLRSAAHRAWWERLCDLSALQRCCGPDGGSPEGAAAGAALIEGWTEELERTLDAFAAAYETPDGVRDGVQDDVHPGVQDGARDPERHAMREDPRTPRARATRGDAPAGAERDAAAADAEMAGDPEPDGWDVDVDLDVDPDIDVDLDLGVGFEVDADVDLSPV